MSLLAARKPLTDGIAPHQQTIWASVLKVLQFGTTRLKKQTSLAKGKKICKIDSNKGKGYPKHSTKTKNCKQSGEKENKQTNKQTNKRRAWKTKRKKI